MPVTMTASPTANGCATVVVTVTLLFERTADITVTPSLRGVVVSSDAADSFVLSNVVQVSSPSVRRIVMYGRHCETQQQFAPVQAPAELHVVGFGLHATSPAFGKNTLL